MLRFVVSTLALAALAMSPTVARADSVVFVRGDADGDARFTPNDLIVLTEWLTSTKSVRCIEALDVDDNGFVDLADVIRLFQLVHTHMAPPPVLTLNFLRGDLDDNGTVDAQDLRQLGRILQGARGPAVLDAADVDKDGRIDSRDAEELRNSLGSPSAFSPQTP